MAVEVKVPSPGESITEVEIADWLVSDGDYVESDDELCEIDSDKATLTVNAEASGVISIKAKAGETVEVGAVIATIDTDAEAPEGSGDEGEEEEKKKEEKEEQKSEKGEEKKEKDQEKEKKDKKEEKKEEEKEEEKTYASGHPSPAADKMMKEKGVEKGQVKGTGKGGRITKADVIQAISKGFDTGKLEGWTGERETERKKMSSLRRKLSERLVSVKNETAMLTTFNEVDMSAVMKLRSQYKEQFKEQHEVGLGFMSFFTKAVTEALYHFPEVNAQIDGQEIIYHKYADIGIAVSSPKGLMVPVIRNAESKSLAEIESDIRELAGKARNGKISLDEMTGGTFTITNGGVFGSMMSTPIINPPQSAILGMHNIVDRPVAIDGKMEIRPMMYLAVSYDHRIIDGKESVSFLVKVKEMIENPVKMLFGGKEPEELLLGL